MAVLLRWSSVLLACSFASIGVATSTDEPLHIIIFLADDLGWDDVSYQGSGRIQTPNIDALALSGVVLSRHYSPPLCTPSRAALLTGKYPSTTGMQHLVIGEPEPWGLPLEEVLLPEYLRREGYATHLLGKWHLGFFQTAYTPTKRGFDSHFGYYQGYQDYWTHMVRGTFENTMNGFDMRRNLSADWSTWGHHTTDLLTREATRLVRDHDPNKPLFLFVSHLAPHAPAQPPHRQNHTVSSGPESEEEAYIRVVEDMDSSVGQVIVELQKKGMLERSLLLFMSDNGAPTRGDYHATKGSNAPFRGLKQSPYEGGVHTAAAVWSAKLARQEAALARGHVSRQLWHSADWLPTLMHAATGQPYNVTGLDGVDLWPALMRQPSNDTSEASRRRADGLPVIVDREYFAILSTDGRWKLAAVNATFVPDGWYGIPDDDHSYDINKVLQSPAGLALSSVLGKSGAPGTRNQSTDFWGPRALSLRESLRVRCSRPLPISPKQCSFERPCLFDLDSDPCESIDVSETRPTLTARLLRVLNESRRRSRPPGNVPTDPKSDPKLHDGLWQPWRDEDVSAGDQGWSWWWALLVVAVISVFVLFCVVRQRRRRRPHPRPAPKAPAPEVPVPTRGHVAARVQQIQERERQSMNGTTNGYSIASNGETL